MNLNYKLFIIVSIGFSFRVLFYLFGAEKYFGSAEFYYNSDSIDYLTAITNFVEKGLYTTSFEFEDGKFSRSPTYSIFIGIFYYLTGSNIILTFKCAVYTQILLDTISILFFYFISSRLFGVLCGLIAALLYALYPFSTIWTSTAYSETLTTFLLLSSIAILLFGFSKRNRTILLLSGVILGIAVLSRVQVLFFLFSLLVSILVSSHVRKTELKNISFFIIGFVIIYSLWPIRNYFLHDRLLFTVTFVPNSYTKDVMSAYKFLGYISPNDKAYTNFLAILHNQDLDIPEFATRDVDDSIKIFNTINNAKNNGYGFSFFWDYWKTDRPNSKDSIEVISRSFDELSKEMIKKYPHKTHLEIPLLNLKKMFFKSTLTNSSEYSKVLIKIIFYYRTVLLIFGIVSALYIVFYNKIFLNWVILTIVTYFFMWYFFMAFGPFRNIEMRYLLYCDVLLLIPAAFILSLLLKRIKSGNFDSSPHIQ